MDTISELWEDLKTNPLVLAGVVVGLLILIYIIRQRMTKAPVVGVATSDGVTTPPVPITYNNTYNSYPVVGTAAPPVTQPPVTQPPVVKPPVTCPSGYHLENGKCEKNAVIPPVVIPPVIPTPKYVIVTHWPEPGSSLSSIAQLNHTTLAKIEALNPQITNPDLIYAGQRVRVS